MLDNDCDEPFVNGIMIDSEAPFRISAFTDFEKGWTDPVCVMCENIDEKVGVEVSII